MATSEDPHGQIIWAKGPVVCTSLTLAPDRIEIAVAVRETVIERRVFSDVDAAGAFAINKMRAYTAP
jgi:hypothetical protein